MKRRTAIKNISLGAGYSMTGLGFASFISSCKQDGSMSSKTLDNWKPSFMSMSESKLVENILDAFLPTTESAPGARELKIVQVVDNVVNKLFKKVDQDDFKSGLAALELRLKKDFKVDASEMTAEQFDHFMQRYMGAENTQEQQNLALLREQDRQKLSSAQQSDYLFAQLLNTLRRQGISAYFSHETIATEHLNYDPVPGIYDGCMPLAEIGNSWSL